jgi:hypothetical protein
MVLLKKTILRSIDIFGTSVPIFMIGEEKFTTVIGGLFSELIGILSILCFIAFGRDLFERQNPTSMIIKEFQKLPIPSKNQLKFYIAPHYDPALGKGDLIQNIEKKLDLFFVYYTTLQVKPH